MTRRRRRRKANPPLTRVRSVGSNMTEAQHGDLTILYSYDTPVAVFVPGAGYLVTDHKFSVTTTKHVSKWVGGEKKTKVPQEVIQHLATNADPEDERVVTALTRTRPLRQLRAPPRTNPHISHPAYRFTEADVGTWIDGAYGEEHAVEKMAEMMDDVISHKGTRILDPGLRQRAINVAEELRHMKRSDDYEFAQEVLLYEATEILQEATDESLVWEWEAGDLFLTEAEE